MIKVKIKGRFDRMYRELVQKNPQLKKEILATIELFKKNPDDTRLDNHPLRKRLQGKWALSITDDLRIVYEWQGKNTVRFLVIGGHERVYKKGLKRNFSSTHF